PLSHPPRSTLFPYTTLFRSLQSPTPAWLKTIAEVSSWMLLVPVFAFTINILGTMKGNWDRFFTNLPLRFTMTAFFFYFLVNIQRSEEHTSELQSLRHLVCRL